MTKTKGDLVVADASETSDGDGDSGWETYYESDIDEPSIAEGESDLQQLEKGAVSVAAASNVLAGEVEAASAAVVHHDLVRSKQGLLVKDFLDVDWPSLSTKLDKDSVLPDATDRVKLYETGNVWTEHGCRKKFMNSGIAKDKKKLDYSPPGSPDSAYLIDVDRAFTMKEVWGHSLLGQYVGRHPGHHAINALRKQWGVPSKYKMEEGWMIFSFETEEDQDKVLVGGPYMIHSRPLILKHVPDKFAFTNKEFATVPLWIRIYGLGSRFWTDEFLGGIASYVGRPLYLDPVTDERKRNSYARVLVEVNLAELVIRRVPLKFSDGDSFVCKIQIENEPKFCGVCCAFGHKECECSFVDKPADLTVLDVQNGIQQMPADINAIDDSGAAVTATDHMDDGYQSVGKIQKTAMVATKTVGVNAKLRQEATDVVNTVPEFIEKTTEDSRPHKVTVSETIRDGVIKEDNKYIGKNMFSVLSFDEDVLDTMSDERKQSKVSAYVAGAQPGSANEPLMRQLTGGGPQTRRRVKGNKVS